MATYESTPHVLAPFPGKNSNNGTTEDDNKPPKISRFDIFDADDDCPAFILHNVLSGEECQYFIDQAESLGMTDTNYSHSIRINDRVCARSEEVARVLFERIRPFLEDSIEIENDNWPYSGTCPRGVSHDFPSGTWTPIGLNECFRLCRYKPGGHFKPHHDGGFARGPFEQSIRTFMLYLNDDFKGGATNFYNENQLHYHEGDPDKVVYSFCPNAGDALIFNSRITHDGGKVLKGRKYIMRSEVMYQNLPCDMPSDTHKSDADAVD